MTQKSPDAFRTISEVADELTLPQHVLRFWETKFPAIRPMKRGGGRRYYRPADVDLLKGIRYLLYSEGYTIKGVQKILKDQGNRFVMELAARAMAERPPVAIKPPRPVEPEAGEPEVGEGAELDVVPVPVLRSGAARAARAQESPPGGNSHAQAPGAGGKDIARLKAALADLRQAREALAKARRA